MINQEFIALGRKYKVLHDFWNLLRELGGSKVSVFTEACAFTALSGRVTPIGGLVYICLPSLRFNLQYFAQVMDLPYKVLPHL